MDRGRPNLSLRIICCRSLLPQWHGLPQQPESPSLPAEIRVVNQLKCFNKWLCKGLFSVCSRHRHQPLIDRVLPGCTTPSTDSANVDCCSCFVQWCDVTGVCLYSVWVSVRQLGRVRPRLMSQTCRHGSVTRHIICGPSSAQFHHSGPRIFYILLITFHVLTPPWDTLVPHGPLHYTQNRRLADRRRKLLPDIRINYQLDAIEYLFT